jgi:hypothetical protein
LIDVDRYCHTWGNSSRALQAGEQATGGCFYLSSQRKDGGRTMPVHSINQRQVCVNHQAQLHPQGWYICAPFSSSIQQQQRSSGFIGSPKEPFPYKLFLLFVCIDSHATHVPTLYQEYGLSSFAQF